MAPFMGIPRRPFLRCLYLHYVFEKDVKNFERFLLWILERAEFVTTDQCVDIIEGKRELPGPAYHLSFDDGCEACHDYAFPVLRDLGVPAAMFVPTRLVGSRRRDSYALRVGFKLHRAEFGFLDWNKIEDMFASGLVEIGSHTRTHRRLADIAGDPALLEDELAGSRRDIGEKLGTECKYMSWPNGFPGGLGVDPSAIAERAGYRAAFDIVRDTAEKSRTYLHRVPRHHIEGFWPFSHMMYFASGGGEPKR